MPSKQTFRLQPGSCVVLLIGNLYKHCMLEFDLVRCASKPEVLANHAQRRRPAQAPNMFLRQRTRRSNLVATPLQTLRARSFNFGSFMTVLANPRLQQVCFFGLSVSNIAWALAVHLYFKGANDVAFC